MPSAKALRLADKTGSLTPGKEADIIILDPTAINVAPLNQVREQSCRSWTAQMSRR